MEQALARIADELNRAAGAVHLPALWLFTDPVRLPDPASAVENLPANSGVVFRHFGVASYLEQGSHMRQLCAARGIRFLAGADANLAERLSADGVHLPERMQAGLAAIKARHPQWLITAAVHSLAAVHAAQGADALFASPVFPSHSPSAGAPIGPGQLKDWIAAARCPVYALGGVNTATAPRLIGTGCAGVAGIEGLILENE